MSSINNALWTMFLRSPPQQSAVLCIIAEIERTELVTPVGIDKQAYERFIADFITELSLYGYCVYRDTANGPVVLTGRHVVLERRGPTRYAPKIVGDAFKSLRGSRGWRVALLQAPEVASNGEFVHPMSAAFKSHPQATQLLCLNRQLQQKDAINSRPAVYTRISKQIGASTGTSVPWFQNAHSSMQVDVLDQPADIQDLIENRAEAIRALDSITHTARAVGPQGSVGGMPSTRDQTHAEHIVSDGRDIDELRHLQQDTEIIHYTVERLAHEIQFAFGCPPQVLGKNINSERMSSSNRLTEMAINHFRTHTRKLREMISGVFADLGAGVTFGDCASLHTLEQIGHLLRPKELIALYACAFELDAGKFDPVLVKRWQNTLAPDTGPVGSAGATAAQPLTEEAKDNKKRKRQDVNT